MTNKQEVPKRRASALGLALVVALAFSAIAASGAQALDWQYWSFPGRTVLSGTSSETVAGTGKGLSITTKLLGQAVEINCPTASTSGSVVAGGTGTSTIALENCAVAQPSSCHLAAQPTLQSNVQLVEAGGALLQKFTPAGGTSGKVFATITFEGTLCPIAEVPTSLTGSFAGRDPSSEIATNHSRAFEPWPEVPLKFGSAPATLRGEVTEHLSGKLLNDRWRGIWQTTHGGWEVDGKASTSSEAAIVSGGPVKFSYHTGGALISFSCSETSASEARRNVGGTETVKNLTFSGCTVEQPSSCTVGPITFAELTGTLMQVNGNVYEKFATTQGGAVTYLSFGGSFCPITGTLRAWSGTFAGLGRQFGVYQYTQPLEFSQAANEATGSSLTSGASAMTMTGTINQTLNAMTWGAF